MTAHPKIEQVETFLVDLPTIRPHQLSMTTMSGQTLMLVRIRTSDGIVGIGEGTTIGGLSYGAESPEGMKLAIDTYITPLLLKADPNRVGATMATIGKAVRDNHFAKCAVETALLDALGKRTGLSVSDLLGGRFHDRLPIAWTLASGDTAKDIAEAEEMGAARKLKFSWGGNPGVGSLHRMRDAVENEWPHRLELEEHSHAAMANAFDAGAANLPFAVFRGYIGADLPKVNPTIKSVTCPYTGETLATVPAIRPDVSIIHALRADKQGNVLLEGILGVQKEAVLAAKRSIVTVEEIVDDFGPRNLNSTILPHWTVTAVAVVPGGAFPSYAQGYYPRDNAFYIAWDKIARDRGTFLAWMQENVMQKSAADFAKRGKKPLAAE